MSAAKVLIPITPSFVANKDLASDIEFSVTAIAILPSSIPSKIRASFSIKDPLVS